jgi:hypothetical protein
MSHAARAAMRGVASSGKLIPDTPSSDSSPGTTKLPLSSAVEPTRTRASRLTKWRSFFDSVEPSEAATSFTSTSVIL